MPIEPVGASSVATVLFRHRGALHLTVIVKASFQWVQGGRAQPIEPAPIERFDRFVDGDPSRGVLRASDLAPFLPRAEVLVAGHAYAPQSLFVPASSVRLGVFREAALLEKTLHVYGDRRALHEPPRPFQRMPLAWELAAGGPGTANPIGVGARAGRAPNLAHPTDPARPASFLPIPASWPQRGALTTQIHGLEPPLFDLEDELDFSYFQAAPEDQRVDALAGDEWILLDGVHPSLPRISTQLPGAWAEALVWCERGPSAGVRWSPQLALDSVFVDADRLRLDLSWRGSFTLPGGDATLPDLRAAAGWTVGAPMAWPDVDAAIAARLELEPPPPVSTTLDATAVHRQETSVALPAVVSAATPWDAHKPAGAFADTDAGASRDADHGPSSDTAWPFRAPLAAPEPAAPAPEPEDVEVTRDALATSSTAPPPPPDDAEASPAIPPPPRPAVVVPPPAVATGRVLGAFALRYDGAAAPSAPPSLGAAPLSPPPLVVSAEAPTEHELPAVGEDVPAPPGAVVPAPPGAVVPAPPGAVVPAPPGAVVPAPPAEPAGTSGETPPPPATEEAAPSAASGPVAAMLARLRAGEALDGIDLAGQDLAGLDLSGASLRGANLSGARLRGARLVGARLGEAKLLGADLEEADLEGADLTRADLARARLVGARLVGAVLAHAILQGVEATNADLTAVKASRVNLTRARLAGAKLARADLANAELAAAILDGVDATEVGAADAVLDDAQADGSRWDGARLVRVRGRGARLGRASLVRVDGAGSSWDRATFDGATLDDGSFTDASFLRVTLVGASLAGVDLRGAKLANVVGEDARLPRAKLDGADLRGARLDRADAEGASLPKIVATKASLEGARLDGADLRGANLRGAKLAGASLGAAQLDEADLRDADLSGALCDGVSVRGARLDGARLDGARGLPDDTSG